jgi:cytochrome P450
MHSAIAALLSILCLYLLKTVLKFRRAIRDVGHLSGPRLLLDPRSFITRVLPPIPYVCQDVSWMLKSEYQDFAAAGKDAIAMVTMFPTPKTTIFLADAAAIKEVTTARSRFPKPFMPFSRVMGDNIVTAEGEEWKRHRKVTAPAFSERNIRLVWDETARVMFDLFDNVWGDNPEIVVDHCVEITLPVG